MYNEQYEKRGLPFKDFFIKLILVIVFAFLLAWLLPKFVQPAVITNAKEANVDLSPLTSQIFADNLDRMKEAAISYYTDERLPKEVGESDTMTLSDMIGKKLIVALVDKNNKACDVDKSYVKITKMENEYLLKVNLKDSEKEDYILVHLGCYTYCDTYICEKKSTGVSSSLSKPTSSVPIKDGVDDTVYGDDNNNSTTPDNPDSELPDPGDEKPEPPEKIKGYLYEYQKNQDAKFTQWTSWSNWTKTSCSTPEHNCNDKDPKCLEKLQRYDRKEQIGTYVKKYEKKRQVLKQTGSYTQKSCSKYNYVIINNITYATTTTTTYKVVQQVITSNGQSSGGWVYNGRASYKNPPRDTATTQYKFVGANYSYCEETCTTLPDYYYDSYVWKGTGGLSSVTSTTTVPGGSSSDTSSDSSTSVSASCGEIVTKTIPIYGYITESEIATRNEPLYGTVCYQSTKTRKLLDSGKTMTKWSKYNDTDLLNNGWYYTGYKKSIK